MRKLIESIETGLEELQQQLNDEVAEFATDAEYENCDSCIYDAPRVGVITKHDYYISYAVLRINKGVVTLCGLGDDYGFKIEPTSINRLTADEIMVIASNIY
jgi:hypothetical protein